MQPIRLIIADDHPVVRAGLQAMLMSQADFLLVGEATTGEEAVELVGRLMPDVVLMDLRMMKMDGVQATARIKKLYEQVAVLILTTYEGNSDILRAIEAGAVGYLLKDTPKEQLFTAIRQVVQGKSVLAPEVAAKLLSHMHAPRMEAPSTREIEVLTLVAHGASNKEVARHLHISEATVKSHLIRIFGKLGVTDRTAAVTVALKRGLLQNLE